MRLSRYVVAFKWVAVSIVVSLFDSAPAWAWQGGTLVGLVQDAATRRPIAGAVIQLRGRPELAVSTNESGRYRLGVAEAGTWVVDVRAIGYRAQAIPDVVTRSGRITPLDILVEPVPLELETIVVHPSLFPDPAVANGSQTFIAAEEIRRAPGAAGDVTRILQNLPALAKVNDQSNGLIVRGGSPLENLILVDGIEIPNINHFPSQGSSGGPIGLLNIDLVSGMQFSAGGFDASHGDRLSSVLDIHFRDGNREEVDAQVDLNFVGFGGVVEGPVPGGSFLISARRSYVDLAAKAFDLGTTAIPKFGDYQGKVTIGLSPKHRLSVLGIASDDRIKSDLETARKNDMLTFGGQDLVQGTVGLSWTGQFGRAVSTTTVAWTKTKFDEQYFEMVSGGRPLLTNQSRETGLRVRHATRWVRGSTEVAFGGSAAREAADYDNRYDSPTPLDVKANFADHRVGGFLSISVAPVPKVVVTGGVRTDYRSLTGSATVSPRLAGSFEVRPGTNLGLAVGLYHQAPPLVLAGQSTANRRLPDSRAVHVVASATRLLRSDLEFKFEAYGKRFDRLPVDPAEPGVLPVDEFYGANGFLGAHPALVARGRATAAGLEFTLQKKLTNRFYGLASIAASRIRYQAADGVWRDRVFDNRGTGAIEAGWKLGRSWGVSTRFLVAGGTPFTPIDVAASRAAGRTVLDPTLINQSRRAAYHSLNVRADRRFRIGGTTMNTFVSVWNAYDRANVAQEYWNPATNRVETITQWRLLPVFGIEWEF